MASHGGPGERCKQALAETQSYGEDVSALPLVGPQAWSTVVPVLAKLGSGLPQPGRDRQAGSGSGWPWGEERLFLSPPKSAVWVFLDKKGK